MSGIYAAWREVKGIVLTLLALLVLTMRTGPRWLVWLLAGLLGWIVYFFRDPDRSPARPLSADDIVAPADGLITAIDQVEKAEFIPGPAQRLTIFLSLFDVHVQRSAYKGQVQYLSYQPGSFAPAFLKQAHQNEANVIGLRTRQGPMVIKQITGVLARRIVCWVDVGDQLATGQRFGLIRFGSRVDLLLPRNAQITARVGQKVYGGQTIVARWQ